MKPQVELRSVSMTFVDGTKAVQDVNLEIHEGEFLAIVGPSGSGKSTLLNVASLLLTPTSGKVFVDGVSVEGAAQATRVQLRSRLLSFVFQSFHLVDHLTAVENVRLGVALSTQAADRPLEAIQEVGLLHRANALPRQMSGGERQRVGVARALARGTPIIVCDEPTGNLDSASAATILSLLGAAHSRGRTVVMVTHDSEAMEGATRLVKLKDGRILEER